MVGDGGPPALGLLLGDSKFTCPLSRDKSSVEMYRAGSGLDPSLASIRYPCGFERDPGKYSWTNRNKNLESSLPGQEL